MTSVTTSEGASHRNPVLAQMYGQGWVAGPEGQRVQVHSRLGPAFADALYDLVVRERPTRVLEVGMAFGASALAILTALDDLGGDGRLVSLDPLQSTLWEGIGQHNVRACGLQERHQLIEEPDYLALPRLLADGRQVDLAYIDGWHTFDYTLLDFFYVDRMLRPGGVVGFNDCDLPAVSRVLDFVRTHRRYDPVETGLIPRYARPAGRLGRLAWGVGRRLPLGERPNRIQRAIGLRADDQYLRKREDWEPDWNFHAPF